MIITLSEYEKLEGELSVLELPKFEGDLFKFINDKKIELVYSQRILVKKNQSIVLKALFKTQQNFFISCENLNETENQEWICTIYFKESSYKELVFFLNNFLKNYKNATINN